MYSVRKLRASNKNKPENLFQKQQDFESASSMFVCLPSKPSFRTTECWYFWNYFFERFTYKFLLLSFYDQVHDLVKMCPLGLKYDVWHFPNKVFKIAFTYIRSILSFRVFLSLCFTGLSLMTNKLLFCFLKLAQSFINILEKLNTLWINF